jgi:hypothetical protein
MRGGHCCCTFVSGVIGLSLFDEPRQAREGQNVAIGL